MAGESEGAAEMCRRYSTVAAQVLIEVCKVQVVRYTYM